MSEKTCSPLMRASLTETFHRDNPLDGPNVKRLKSFTKKLSIEVIWEELDAWSTAQVTARLADWEEKRS